MEDLHIQTTLSVADLVSIAFSLLALLGAGLTYILSWQEKRKNLPRLSVEWVETVMTQNGRADGASHTLEMANYGGAPMVIRKIFINQRAVLTPGRVLPFRLGSGDYAHLDWSGVLAPHLLKPGVWGWIRWLVWSDPDITVLDGHGRRWKAQKIRKHVEALPAESLDSPLASAPRFSYERVP